MYIVLYLASRGQSVYERDAVLPVGINESLKKKKKRFWNCSFESSSCYFKSRWEADRVVAGSRDACLRFLTWRECSRAGVLLPFHTCIFSSPAKTSPPEERRIKGQKAVWTLRPAERCLHCAGGVGGWFDASLGWIFFLKSNLVRKNIYCIFSKQDLTADVELATSSSCGFSWTPSGGTRSSPDHPTRLRSHNFSLLTEYICCSSSSIEHILNTQVASLWMKPDGLGAFTAPLEKNTRAVQLTCLCPLKTLKNCMIVYVIETFQD